MNGVATLLCMPVAEGALRPLVKPKQEKVVVAV